MRKDKERSFADRVKQAAREHGPAVAVAALAGVYTASGKSGIGWKKAARNTVLFLLLFAGLGLIARFLTLFMAGKLYTWYFQNVKSTLGMADPVTGLISICLVACTFLVGPYLLSAALFGFSPKRLVIIPLVLSAGLLAVYFASQPKEGQYFDPINGHAMYKYCRSEDGKIQLFPLGYNFNPETQEQLRLIDGFVAVQHRKQTSGEKVFRPISHRLFYKYGPDGMTYDFVYKHIVNTRRSLDLASSYYRDYGNTILDPIPSGVGSSKARLMNGVNWYWFAAVPSEVTERATPGTLRDQNGNPYHLYFGHLRYSIRFVGSSEDGQSTRVIFKASNPPTPAGELPARCIWFKPVGSKSSKLVDEYGHTHWLLEDKGMYPYSLGELQALLRFSSPPELSADLRARLLNPGESLENELVFPPLEQGVGRFMLDDPHFDSPIVVVLQ